MQLIARFIFAGLLALSLLAHAEESTSMPVKGSTMEQVVTKIGEPEQKLQPVGTPAITRWHYENQTLYFENDRLLQAVTHRQK